MSCPNIVVKDRGCWPGGIPEIISAECLRFPRADISLGDDGECSWLRMGVCAHPSRGNHVPRALHPRQPSLEKMEGKD